MKKMDIFGCEIVFNLDEKHKLLTTKIGGLFTIIYFLLSLGFIQYEILGVVNVDNYKFHEMKYNYNSSLYQNTSMGDYADSFNMFIGTTNQEFDWFDNSYITPNVYRIKQTNNQYQISLD